MVDKLGTEKVIFSLIHFLKLAHGQSHYAVSIPRPVKFKVIEYSDKISVYLVADLQFIDSAFHIIGRTQYTVIYALNRKTRRKHKPTVFSPEGIKFIKTTVQ